MDRRLDILTTTWLVAIVVVGPMCVPIATANTFVALQYNLYDSGQNALDTVFIELFDDRPLTRDNFLAYVDAGRYDETIMHRLSRGFVLQGGGFYQDLQPEPPPLNVALNPNARVDLDGNPATSNPTVPNEFTNAPMRSNLVGTLAMAKLGGNPDSATNQWFFNLGNNSANLDNQNGGFTVFAQVVGNGMNLINAYNNSLSITNLNPDVNNDGVRDGNTFGNEASRINGILTDGVPFRGSSLLRLESARRIRYLKGGESSNVATTGLTFSLQDTFIDSGHQFSGSTNGRIIGNVNVTLGFASGFVLNRPLLVLGDLDIGNQLGTLATTSYEQGSAANLNLQVLVNTTGTQHDQLIVSGLARLNGTLNLDFIGFSQPNAGQSLTLIQAAAFQGSFAEINLPDLSGGLRFVTRQTPTALVADVVGMFGDYNHDGFVDAADFSVWRDTLGSVDSLAADGNRNGIVDVGDYTVWRTAFGSVAAAIGSVGVGGTAVPEPTGIAVIVSIGLGFVIAQQKRHRA